MAKVPVVNNAFLIWSLTTFFLAADSLATFSFFNTCQLSPHSCVVSVAAASVFTFPIHMLFHRSFSNVVQFPTVAICICVLFFLFPYISVVASLSLQFSLPFPHWCHICFPQFPQVLPFTRRHSACLPSVLSIDAVRPFKNQ